MSAVADLGEGGRVRYFFLANQRVPLCYSFTIHFTIDFLPSIFSILPSNFRRTTPKVLLKAPLRIESWPKIKHRAFILYFFSVVTLTRRSKIHVGELWVHVT